MDWESGLRSQQQNLENAWVKAAEIIPAAVFFIFITLIIFGIQLMPFGKGMFVIRIDKSNSKSALMADVMADISFVSIPAPGFVVVYGEASKLRGAFGLVTPWKGNAPCSPKL